jgi:hypothetical protein
MFGRPRCSPASLGGGALCSASLLAALVSVASLGACSDDGADPPPPDAGPSADCLEAANHSDLAFIQDKIFTPGCASFTSCHRGAATSAGELSLEAGQSLAQMLDKPSDIDPSKKLIKAGDPANSYLMIITGKYPGVIDPTIGTMPSRNPLLCAEKLDAMDRWIAAGAPAS